MPTTPNRGYILPEYRATGKQENFDKQIAAWTALDEDMADALQFALPLSTGSRILQQFAFTPAYDLVSGTLATDLAIGTPDAAITINIPSGKQLNGFSLRLTNSGEGKLFGFASIVEATGATQDAGQEPVRAFIGRAINSGTGNKKTTGLRIGATGSGSNASLLVGVDADVTVVAGTDQGSSALLAEIFGTADDRASYLLWGAADGARALLGVGSFGPVEFAQAAFRAWMATGGAAGARMFQGYNNGGTEITFIDKVGNALFNGLLIDANTEAGTSGFEYRGLFGGNKYTLFTHGEVNTTDKGHLNRGHRGTTSPTAVAVGDILSNLYFQGYDGAGYVTSSSISGIVDGTVSSGQVPGKIDFATRQGGSLSVKMSIGSAVFLIGTFLNFDEMTAPAAPGANQARIYAEDNGAGKTRLMARFPTGAAVQIAIEP